ncbi:MAG: PilW family protein [Methylobacter sp.]
MRNKSYQSGMTLIEIMIALLIGAFLLGGVIEIFVGSSQTNRMQQNLSRLQENGRFAMEFLSSNIRMAGSRGCSRTATITGASNNAAVFTSDFNTALQGFEATSSSAWTPTINSAITSPLGGSDVITIRRVDDQVNYITAHTTGTAVLTLAATTGLSAGDVVLVSDCSGAEAFQIASIAGNTVTLQSAPSKSYSGGEIAPINTISYYVRTNTTTNLPSLFRRVDSTGADELIEGIEQMQILYGVDTDATPDGAPNYYVSANNVADMSKVISIRISLLAVTLDDNIAAQPLAYTYNGTTTTPTDRKIRRVFNITIAVRNRLS